MLVSSFASPLAPLDDVCRTLVARVCPLFILPAPRQPFLIGTGIPVQIGRISVIATAAHVLRRYPSGPVLTMGVTEPLILTGERRGFEHIAGKTADADLALIVLNDEERIAMRNHYEFSYASSFAAPNGVGGGSFYGVVGYLQSQNKPSPRLMRSNRATANYFISPRRVAVDGLKLPGKFEAIHFALGAPAKGAIGTDGRRVSFPSPSGVSGGGVWRLQFDQNPAAAPRPRLVGVLIEYHRGLGLFICTRIRQIESMVRDLA